MFFFLANFTSNILMVLEFRIVRTQNRKGNNLNDVIALSQFAEQQQDKKQWFCEKKKNSSHKRSHILIYLFFLYTNESRASPFLRKWHETKEKDVEQLPQQFSFILLLFFVHSKHKERRHEIKWRWMFASVFHRMQNESDCRAQGERRT